MNSKKYLIFFFLIFFVSCANSKLSKSESCTYPQEKLEKGGLINRIIDKDAIEDSFKKYICYEYPKYRLIYPIPYSANVDFSIMGEKIKLSEKNFRESRIIIKEKKFNKISEDNLKRIKIERELFNEKILIRTQKKYRSTEFVYPAEGIVSSEYGVKRFINNLPRNPHLWSRTT